MGNIDERHRSDRRRKLIYDANKVDADGASVMPAVHASLPIEPDPAHELALSSHLRTAMTAAEIAELYGRFSAGLGSFDAMMRRVIWRSLARSFGNSVRIAPQAMFRHLERVSIGDGVFIGEGSHGPRPFSWRLSPC
jgi:hypothetical protein